jgi:hypothetical protein
LNLRILEEETTSNKHKAVHINAEKKENNELGKTRVKSEDG